MNDSEAILFQQGIEFFNRQAYLDAFLSFDGLLGRSPQGRRALQQHPDNALLWGWLGRTLTHMSYGHLDDRRNQLPPEYANAWISIQDATSWWQACHVESRACLDRALELDPKNAEFWQFLAEYWLQQGYYHNRNDELRTQDYAEALKAIEHAITLDSNNSNLWKKQIEICGKMYHNEAALKSAERLVQLIPDDADAWNTHAYYAYILNHNEVAIASYDRALALALEDDQKRRAYWGRGKVLEQLGEDEAALASYDQALQYPGCIGSQRYQAEALRHRLVLKNLERTLESNPNDWETWYAKAKQHEKQEEYEAAIPCYDQILQIQPDRADMLKGRSFAHDWLGNYDAALTDIERAITLQPDNLDFVHQKGRILTHTEEYEKAIACYDQVFAHNSEDVDLLYNRAMAILRCNFSPEMLPEKMASALENFDRLISLVPELSEGYSEEIAANVWYARGLVLINLERYEEALLSNIRANRWFRASLEDPEEDRALLESLQTAQGWYSWGHYLVCNGYENYREAVIILKKAIELDPNHHKALSFCAYALLKLKRYKEAVFYYEKALALQPEDAKDWHNLGNAQMNIGRYEDAVASYERALALHPDDPQTIACRANALRHLEQ